MDDEDIMNAKRKKRKATMNRYVSPDIIEEILSYLPCKSILRFKVVSKQWKSLLHDSRFIDKHRCRNMIQPSHFLYFDSDDTKMTLHMYEVYVNGYSHVKSIKTALSKSYAAFIQSSYGLVCLYGYYNRKIVIFNPITEHIKNLQDFPEPFYSLPLENFCLRLKYFNFLGFGFDVKSKKYKVVQVVRDLKTHRISKCHVLTVERFESCWREINDASLDCKVEDYKLPVCVGGVIYWETKLMASDKRICIMRFDLSCEKIKMIFGPEECKDVRYRSWQRHMVELQGNLCFAAVIDEYMDIWRLNYSSDGCVGWAPMYKLELGSWFKWHDIVPLCINGRRIILRDGRVMYCYDVEKKCFKIYKGGGENLGFTPGLVHTETIALLD